MTKLQIEQLQVLADTALHFNSKNRSVISERDGGCIYAGRGCAVGRLIPDKELCAKLDAGPLVGITSSSVWAQIPEDVKRLRMGFLADLQNLHDHECNWYPEGLTDKGLEAVNEIAKKVLLGY